MNESFFLLEEFAKWIKVNRLELENNGTLVTTSRSPEDGRSKASILLDLDTKDHLGRLMIWDSGEAELELAAVASGEVRMKHLEIDTFNSLQVTLTTLVVWILPSLDKDNKGN